MREEEEEMPKSTRTAPPTKFPPTVRVEDVLVQVKVPPQRKQPLLVKHGQACCSRVGIGVESHSAESDVDQKRRCGKHDKAEGPIRVLIPMLSSLF